MKKDIPMYPNVGHVIEDMGFGREAMTPQEINRAFHEAIGKCWHDRVWAIDKCKRCGDISGEINPDYCADPRLVLKEMMERDDWEEFLEKMDVGNSWEYPKPNAYIYLDLLMDDKGKLALLAIEWLRK